MTNSFKVNKVVRTNDLTYRTVDDALTRTIPLDVMDIIIGYTRYEKTHYHTQLLEQVQKKKQDIRKMSPIFYNKVKCMIGKINRVKGRLNKLYLSFMLFDYICDFRFLFRDSSSSLRLINAIKNKLNFFYFTEKIVNIRIYYTILVGEDIDPENIVRPTEKHRRLCSLCKLPGHDKRKCEQLDLFSVINRDIF